MRLIDADTLPISFDGHTVGVWKKDLDAAPTVNPYEWISVEDRLPEKHQCVLAYHKYEPESPDVICENTYFSGGFWLSDGSKVTHWMPLPSPPTEKEN